MPVTPWIALGGTARRYLNTITREEISRERYEREHGSLAARGARTFKQAARRTPPELRATRPSKALSYGRMKPQGPSKLSGLRPLAGRQSRSVSIPFHAYWVGDISDFLSDADPYRGGYDDAVKRIYGNKRIRAMQVFYVFLNPLSGISGVRAANTTEAVHDEDGSVSNVVDTYDQVLQAIIDRLKNSVRVEIIALEIRVLFFQKYIKPVTNPRGLRLKPKKVGKLKKVGKQPKKAKGRSK